MNINPALILASFAAKLFICLFILILWRWSLFNGVDSTAMAPLIRSRNKAITIGLLGCMSLGLLSFVNLSTTIGHLAPLIGLGFYFAYLHLDPTKVGYWHHKRMRPIGVTLGLVGTLVLGVFSFDQALAGLFFATLIFHRHQKFSRILVRDQLRNQEQLQKKILCLEGECINLSIRADVNRLSNQQVALVNSPTEHAHATRLVRNWRSPDDSSLQKS